MISGKQYAIAWQEFHQDCHKLSAQLAEHSFKRIIAIARGGLIPAGILARELNIRDIDVICLQSYQHQSQGEIELIKSVSGDGEGCLLVDDLLDSGKTAQYCKALLPKAKLAAVYVKPQAEQLADFYSRKAEQQCWLYFPWDCAWSYQEPMKGE
jgi:xanthine phosphoribosyltransferase